MSMKNTTKESGFSLIELMVVIAIVALLAAVSVPAYQNYMNRAKVSTAIGIIESLGKRIQNHYTITGNWSVTANDIIPGSSNTSGNPDFVDNPKDISVIFDRVNFATANYPCTNAPGGILYVSQLLGYLDSNEFSSGYVTSQSFVQLLQANTGDDSSLVSAIAISRNSNSDVEYIGYGKPVTMIGSGSVVFMSAVCSTYN